MRLLLSLLIFAAMSVGQTTITLNGANYTLTGHPRVYFDGPSGVITTGIKDPDGAGSAVAPKAAAGNPPWMAIQSRAPFFLNNYPYSNKNNIAYYIGGQQAAMFAMYWYSDNTQTAYHDAALYMLNHIEQYFPLICDETQATDCIAGGGTGYYVGSYGMVFWLPQWIFAYELMRGEMTAQQQTDFASKVLNDNSSFGGTTGAPGTSCTNPTVNTGVNITVAGGVITAASPLFGSDNGIQVGDWVAMSTGAGYNTAIIVSVTDSTHAAVSSTTAGAWNGYSGGITYRRGSWQDGDCGLIWVGKHGRYFPQSLTYVNGASAYISGGAAADPGSNNTFALIPQIIAAFLSLADDDGNSSTRSLAQLTTLYSDWYTNIWGAIVEKGYTGFHFTGSNYGMERPIETMKVPAMLTWSINGPAPTIGNGVWAKATLYQYFMNWLPSCASVEPQFGQDFAINAFGGLADTNMMSNATMLYALYRNTNEGKWFNWALRNRISTCGTYGNMPGSNLFWTTNGLAGASVYAVSEWEYAHTDPSWPVSDPSASGPTAVALNQADATSGAFPQSVLISRTGYGSVADTLLNFYGMSEHAFDHNLPAGGWYPGTYKLFKGNFLTASDGGNYTSYSNVYNNYHGGGSYSNYMELGGANNLTTQSPCGASMPRANTDGTNNRFAYAMIDSTPCYVTGATANRVQRHLIDFKGGTQQFIVVYDDVATSAGKLKRTYLHYPNNLGASTDSARGTTTLSGSMVTSTNPGTGHGDGTQLLTQVLAPGTNQVYVYTDHADGTYTGGQGSTFRVSACASSDGASCDSTNKLAEFLVVHEPVSGIGNSLPPVSLLVSDANWRAVQVGGASAKIALFARNGVTYQKASFTSTHTGVAQIAVAGLKPGPYIVLGPSPATGVVGADGVFYFEGVAGSYIVQPPRPPSCLIVGGVCITGQGGIR